MFLVTALAATTTSSHNGWSYGGRNAPNTWVHTYPRCGGFRQSPVALVTEKALLSTTCEPFEFINYDVPPSAMTVTNSGHSAQVNMAINASVSGGKLPGEYIFSQLHFHWGATNTRGSEHTVDGVRFPAELHLVHYNRRYGSMGRALKHDGGLAVFSVLLKLSPLDNPFLKSIIDSLIKIGKPGESACTVPVPLQDFLPSTTENFFRYEGSLTTPPCTEVVVWTVFRKTISISSNQLEQFRQLVDAECCPLQDNFRDLQPLNGRQVYMS